MAEMTYVNRRAAAGELSASIAHEVSQPLTGILARASAGLNWLRREEPDLAKAEASLQQIVEAAQNAASVVSRVRAMFKKETNEKAQVDLNGIVLTVLKIVQVDLRSTGIDLQVQLKDDLPAVIGDRVQLQQVVLNLVVNAIDAMHSSQVRTLLVQSDHLRPGFVNVSVADTGTGIDPSNLDQIFEPLFTTKSQGIGMGLSICRSIIETHGGRIWVSPSPTGGSIFHIELPTLESSQPSIVEFGH